VELLIIIIILK